LRPGCEELAVTDPLPPPKRMQRGAAGREARPREPKTATVERREASVPRHGTQGASLGAWHRCVISAFTRVFDAMLRAQRVSRKHPNVSRRSAHPSMGMSEAKNKNPGAKNAPRERGDVCCLSP